MEKMKATVSILLATCLLVGVPSAVLAQTPEDDGSVPAEFTGRWEFATTIESGSRRSTAGRTDDMGGIWQYRVLEMSDPRMDGEVTISANKIEFDGVDTDIYNGAFRVENASGAWQELPTLTLTLPDGAGSTRTSAMIGERAYEGLTAIAEFAWDRTSSAFDIRGVIIEGALPPPPGSAVED